MRRSTEYDFDGGERGKFAADYARGTNVVLLEPDLMDVFPDSESVNAALRPIAELIRSKGKATGVSSPK
jgi:hypothetical protein